VVGPPAAFLLKNAPKRYFSPAVPAFVLTSGVTKMGGAVGRSRGWALHRT